MVYLLHFKEPYKGVQHYIGFTDNLEKRLSEHRKGTGARLCAAFERSGIDFELAQTWEGDRKFERQLKNKKQVDG